jgi:hypothetical protein
VETEFVGALRGRPFPLAVDLVGLVGRVGHRNVGRGSNGNDHDGGRCVGNDGCGCGREDGRGFGERVVGEVWDGKRGRCS